jgi:YesN/AraC family two-component response regulator
MHVKICTVMSSQIIDYLLKPIDREENKKSSAKMFKESFSNNSPATAGNTKACK